MYLLELNKAAQFIKQADPGWSSRRLAIVLGSGWGAVVEALMDVEGSLDYGSIPGFPVSTVAGHAGRLVWGRLGGADCYVMQGRFHFYEGYSMQQITLPVRVFALLAVKGVLLTNAAGGINPGFSPGSLMLIEDHLNFMGGHPLKGPNLADFGPRFPDMTAAWDPVLRDLMQASAREAGVTLHSGVYIAVSGPSFETPAEIRAFARLGADAVGMSTVPECLVARHSGLRVVGLSCITNLAAHVGGEPLSHEDVSLAARESEKQVRSLLESAVPRLSKELEE